MLPTGIQLNFGEMFPIESVKGKDKADKKTCGELEERSWINYIQVSYVS